MERFGATVVVMEKFDPERALAAIETFPGTHSQWVPTHLIRMLTLPAEVRAKFDPSSLRYAVHAAAPCPVPVKEQMIEWWGPVLHEYYSGTEGICFTYANSADWLAHKGTVGRSLVGEPHVCDGNGAELPAGHVGTLYFSGGPTFEYHGDPEKTAASRDPRGRGWATLGDVGYLDEDGFLYLTDRVSHAIISGGVMSTRRRARTWLAWTRRAPTWPSSAFPIRRWASRSRRSCSRSPWRTPGRSWPPSLSLTAGRAKYAGNRQQGCRKSVPHWLRLG